MAMKSHGSRRRTRSKYRGAPKFKVNKFIKNFKIGESVAIVTDSSSKSLPFGRFHGLTGKVAGKRGAAYLVQIKDGNKLKTVISRPEHLKAV